MRTKKYSMQSGKSERDTAVHSIEIVQRRVIESERRVQFTLSEAGVIGLSPDATAEVRDVDIAMRSASYSEQQRDVKT